MRRRFGKALVAGVIMGLLAWSASRSAPEPIDPVAAKVRLQARLQRLVSEDGFAGVVRIDLGDQTLMRTGVGLADPPAHRPFTPATEVEMGSIGKSFTSVAILKLRDAGMLSLDDTLSRFFPTTPADKRGVTIRQMLTHTAGLGMYVPRADGSLGNDTMPLDRATFERRVLAAPLIAQPGAQFEYSNLGYGLLAAIVERVSGRSYADFLHDEVLAPGGATHTGFLPVYHRDNAETSLDGRAIGDLAWGPDGPTWAILGAGGLVTTADDMIVWRKAFLAGKIVGPASVAEATTGGVDEGPGRPERYGFGVGIQQHPIYGRMIWHNGGDNWFTSDFRQMTEAGVTMFVATNSRENATSAATKLSRALFGAPDAPQQPQGMPAERQLIEAFVTALGSADPGARQAFLAARVGPVFLQHEGLPTIGARFAAMHDQLSALRFDHAQFGSPGQVVLHYLTPGDHPGALVQVELGGTPDMPRVAGFSLISEFGS